MPNLRGRRAVWKGPFFVPFNLPKINAQTVAENANYEIRTMARSCTIMPSFVGHTFHVHNGKKFLPVSVTENMIGHRLGEFSFTKKVPVYPKDPVSLKQKSKKK